MKRRSLLAATLPVAVVGTLGVLGVTNASAAALNPALPPGGNFDLSVWSLQLPIGSPGKPDIIPPSRLKGANGYTNPSFFWTDKNDGSMTFWAPAKGVTTPNSKYARSELREMNPNGSGADWPLAGNHTLSAQLRVVSVTKNVAVGNVSGNRASLTVNGNRTNYAIPSSFNPHKQYFKAGSYNQSSSQSTSNGAKVKFYSLTVRHG